MTDLRIYSVPTLAGTEGDESGIVRVVQAYHRYLTERGMTFVTRKNEPHDLSVSHAGSAIGTDVVHCHGLYWTQEYDGSTWEWAVNKNVIEACRRAKVITVPSNWVAETFRRDMRVNPVILPHGIEWDEWQIPQETRAYVLWNKNRSGDVCDPAPVGILAEAFPELHFVTTFAPKRKPSNIREIGKVPHPEMKSWVNDAMVYLSTTKETFGIGILEAMACGVPVLGFDEGGIKDLIVHGETGYLAKSNDYADLQEGLRYCVRNRKVLGANAREAAKTFAWKATIDKVIDVYTLATMPETPNLAVVIPCFNYAHKAEKAIQSAMMQTCETLTDIVVVDDGSDDSAELEKLVRRLQKLDSRIRYIWQENQGVAVARNRGISEVDTKYVCCLDADDWIEPTFLDKMLPPLEDDRSVGITYSSLHWHKPDGTDGLSQWPGKWDFDRQIRRQNQVPTCCVFRREMWARLGGYRKRYAPRGAGSEDAEFWTRSGAIGFQAVKASEEGLFHYAWMSGHVTGDPEYREVDWLAWHPWTRDGDHPFASYAKPDRISHPVRQYDQPLVSVIIPVGPTHEDTLIDALDSLEAQTFRNWEAIVVWDQPTDIPQSLTKAYPYVHWLNLVGNYGAGEARNDGVHLAQGPFLLFLDADDWLYPEAIELMVKAWDDDEAIIYTDYVGKTVLDNPKMLAPNLQEKLYQYDEASGDAVIGYRSADFNCFEAQKQPVLETYPFIWSLVTALIPKVWHDEIGGFDESMASWEDADYHWRMARAGKCYTRIPKELMVVRFHTGSRRDLGLQEHKGLIKYLQRKYKEIPAVGCNCGGNRTSRVQSKSFSPRTIGGGAAIANRTLAQEEPMSDQDYVLVKYIHPNRGKHKVVGAATRTDYGRRAGGDEFLMHMADVQRQAHLFIELNVRPPAEPPKVTRPPVAVTDRVVKGMELVGAVVDEAATIPPQPIEERPSLLTDLELQLLPGVTNAIEKDMKKAGLSTIEAVQEAGVEGLMRVRGIGQVKAEAIIQFVNSLVAHGA